MKKLFFVLFLTSLVCVCLGSSRAPSKVVVDGGYEMQHADSTGSRLFGSLTSGLDTLAGADSVQIFKKYSPNLDGGWEHILITNALSGDSSATTVCEVILKSYDMNDSLMLFGIIDTFAAAGGAILLPFGHSKYGIGTSFDAYIKSKNTDSETVIQKPWHYKRRARQVQTIK